MKARGGGHHIQWCADGHKPSKMARCCLKIEYHVQCRRTAKRMGHHEDRHARIEVSGGRDKGDEVSPGAGIIGAARQRPASPGPAHIYPQQTETGIQRRRNQPPDMLSVHTAIQPVNGDDTTPRAGRACLATLPGRMKGGEQLVTIIQIKADVLRWRRWRGVVTQEMPDRLGIAANPGKGLAAKGRDAGAGIVADETHNAARNQ